MLTKKRFYKYRRFLRENYLRKSYIFIGKVLFNGYERKVLLSFCQTDDKVLAKLCHAYGKVVPPNWQSFAIRMAEPCHLDGKNKRFIPYRYNLGVGKLILTGLLENQRFLLAIQVEGDGAVFRYFDVARPTAADVQVDIAFLQRDAAFRPFQV